MCTIDKSFLGGGQVCWVWIDTGKIAGLTRIIHETRLLNGSGAEDRGENFIFAVRFSALAVQVVCVNNSGLRQAEHLLTDGFVKRAYLEVAVVHDSIWL